MAKKMTKAARRRHIREAGLVRCPYCGADIRETGEYGAPGHAEDGSIEQMVECTLCNRRWIDVFALVEVREIASLAE